MTERKDLESLSTPTAFSLEQLANLSELAVPKDDTDRVEYKAFTSDNSPLFGASYFFKFDESGQLMVQDYSMDRKNWYVATKHFASAHLSDVSFFVKEAEYDPSSFRSKAAWKKAAATTTETRVKTTVATAETQPAMIEETTLKRLPDWGEWQAFDRGGAMRIELLRLLYLDAGMKPNEICENIFPDIERRNLMYTLQKGNIRRANENIVMTKGKAIDMAKAKIAAWVEAGKIKLHDLAEVHTALSLDTKTEVSAPLPALRLKRQRSTPKAPTVTVSDFVPNKPKVPENVPFGERGEKPFVPKPKKKVGLPKNKFSIDASFAPGFVVEKISKKELIELVDQEDPSFTFVGTRNLRGKDVPQRIYVFGENGIDIYRNQKFVKNVPADAENLTKLINRLELEAAFALGYLEQ